MARIGPQKRILKGSKPKSKAVKDAADRAARRSKGLPIDKPVAPIDPVITPAMELPGYAEAVAKAEAEAKEATAKKKAAAIAKRKRRRIRYTPALGKAICKMMSMGLSPIEIGRRPLMPKEATIYDWASNPDHPFSQVYTRARTLWGYRLLDQTLDLADKSSSDWTTKALKSGEVVDVVNREAIERTKLRIETRKWVLEKALLQILARQPHQAEAAATGDRPMDTGEDHLADITRRYQAAVPAAKVNGLHSNGSASGRANGSGVH